LTGGPTTDKGICDLRGELTELTLPEIRHLITRLVWHLDQASEQVLHWSHWRRRHQARARRFHYATREARYVRL
jgi:nicotinamidase-related amidase